MPLSVILKRVEVGGDNFLSDVKHDFQKNINVAYEIDHRFSSPGVPGVSTPFLADQVPCFESKKLRKLTHVASGRTKWRVGDKSVPSSGEPHAKASLVLAFGDGG